MSGSSKIFEVNPPTEPEWSDEEGDPYARMDAVDSDKRQKLADNIDWLAREHRELVKAHGPKSGDIQDDGLAKKD
jgi:hypothetical protein